MHIRVPHLTTSLTCPLLPLEKHFLTRQVAIEAWFRQQWRKHRPPFYGSIDLRNAGFKLAPVDTNLFPAGFNNLNRDFMPLCIQAMQATIAEICPDVTRVLLIPENHTRNLFYFESLRRLQEILQGAGFAVRIGTLNPEIQQETIFDLPSGANVRLEPLLREGDKVGVKNFFPCCIILNNDFSDGVPEILQGVSQTIMPPFQLGWISRLKSEHFHYYQEVANDFAQSIELDPWLINPYFDQCADLDFSKQDGQGCLQDRAEKLFEKIREKYAEYKIEKPPFLVIKADQGTYGMAVMMIKNAGELSQLNRKQRTRMSTLKGGRPVTRAIIQEGVYTFETAGEDNGVAEPVVYAIGRHVIGGFYRVHQNKGEDENLNAPGMDFVPFPFVEAGHTTCDLPDSCANRFYSYGVVARLALLAAAREMEAFEAQGESRAL